MTVYVCACVCVYACVLETLLLPYYILKVKEDSEKMGLKLKVAEAAAQGRGIQLFVLLVNVFAPVCVNGSCDHDTQACWKKARAQINHRPQCATGDPRGLLSELKTNFRFYY